MEPEAFLEWVLPHARELRRRYCLHGWKIRIRVVSDDQLSPKNAAEVSVREEYRSATIFIAESLVRRGEEESLLAVVEHELQHVFLYPMEALKSLVLDALPEDLRPVINNEFYRTNERVRAAIDGLLSQSDAAADEGASHLELPQEASASYACARQRTSFRRA